MTPLMKNMAHSLVNRLNKQNREMAITSIRRLRKNLSDFYTTIPFLGLGSAAGLVFDHVPIFESMSLLPTKRDWAIKWKNSAGKRILFYAYKDYSGSLYRWAEALNEHSEYAARIVTSVVHPYGYESDILGVDCVPRSVKKAARRLVSSQERIAALAEEASIIHYKEEEQLFLRRKRGWYPTLPSLIRSAARTKGIPEVFTFCGGIARKHWSDKRYIDFVRGFDARVAMTPDLNYEWFNGAYIPHAINTDLYSRVWGDGLIASHSPSTSVRKATKEFVLAAQRLSAEIPQLRTDLITNVPHAECMERKQRATLFFDQAGRERDARWAGDGVIGWYGNSAIEAMAFGIPTIAHLSEIAFKGAERAGLDLRHLCPIIGVGCEDVESLFKAMQAFFLATPEEREMQSLKTRQWAVDFHGYKAVAERLTSFYAALTGPA